MRMTVECPYCGEANEILVDPTGGSVQQYVEDCQICCAPWQVLVRTAPALSVELRKIDD
ncbi:MAG: CPXCG motif-containing cysteine-rich protein [Thermoanaerobaculia bacterium]